MYILIRRVLCILLEADLPNILMLYIPLKNAVAFVATLSRVYSSVHVKRKLRPHSGGCRDSLMSMLVTVSRVRHLASKQAGLALFSIQSRSTMGVAETNTRRSGEIVWGREVEGGLGQDGRGCEYERCASYSFITVSFRSRLPPFANWSKNNLNHI